MKSFLKIYAKNYFLGHGFSRVHYSSLQPSSRFVLRSACEITDSDIVMSEPSGVQIQRIGYSESETVNQLSSSIDFAFLLPLRVNFGAQIQRENRQEQRDNTIELVYSFFRYESIHSRLVELPDRSEVEARGDSFVHSGHLHVGYEVHVKIKLRKKENEDISKLMGSINASFLGAELKLGGSRLQEQLDVSRVLDVSAYARNVGEFRPNVTKIRSIPEALTTIEMIEEDFCQFLPQLQQFCVFINPDRDVIRYGELPELAARRSLPETDLKEETVPKTLIDLGKQLHEELPKSDQNIINEANINLSTLFETMYVTLGNTIRENQRFSEHRRVMAMGRTRLGKSVVMGHLLGHPLAMSEIQGALRVEYSNEHFAGRRPKIGHRHAAETKGIFVYTEHPDTDILEAIDCIDCAGTLDTEHSVETDICNAISTAVAVKRRAPTAILVVMPSTWIT
ncbi:MAG: hypothetical protein LRY67_06375, partial [Gammaproteobacteria bacterium]|nr:hypothetical protein [Gammaproteobacteria bacterium]